MALTKHKRWESKKYRDAARGEDCKMNLEGCKNDTTTVVLAHANGGGMGTKQDDWNSCDACDYCHSILDNRVKHGFDRTYILRQFNDGRLKTIINRIERGIIK